jgi:16S rRNA (cytidine1402-2'-O)-methyltransferase
VGGALIVVATPIGNLGDLSPRAATTLCEVDLVLAEDTRRTGRLLAHVGSEVPQRSLHEHNEQERLAEVLGRLEAGERIALVSDAGTPAVSDPGYRLLAACVERAITVEVVPGPSAVLAALVASGLPTDRVAFDGFLPRKVAARRRRLEELASEPRTVVLFVSPHRAADEVRELAGALGDGRRAALARELTKRHEEVWHGTLGSLADRLGGQPPKGELTLVVAGAAPAAPAVLTDAELVGRVHEMVASGATKKAAIAAVAQAVARPKREVYQAVVDAGS